MCCFFVFIKVSYCIYLSLILIFTPVGAQVVAMSKGIHLIGGEICPCQFKMLTRKKKLLFSASENDTEKTECCQTAPEKGPVTGEGFS